MARETSRIKKVSLHRENSLIRHSWDHNKVGLSILHHYVHLPHHLHITIQHSIYSITIQHSSSTQHFQISLLLFVLFISFYYTKWVSTSSTFIFCLICSSPQFSSCLGTPHFKTKPQNDFLGSFPLQPISSSRW